MKLLYLAHIRLPTERAHGLQIVQNCEAFADAGADVTLWTARRWQTRALRPVHDIHAHYGVKANFTIRRVPVIDLLPLVPGVTNIFSQLIFALGLISYTIAVTIGVAFSRAEVLYSRDALVLLIVGLITRRPVVYEAHMLADGRFSGAIQRRVLRRADRVYATTRTLAEALIARGGRADRVDVAHDGIRADRFADQPHAGGAKHDAGWGGAPFVVGYIGRLHTVGIDKGVGMLVDAAARADGVAVAIVGGPDEGIAALRERWRAARGSEDGFHATGQVDPEWVPGLLAACDACAIPFPPNPHFALHASPMKLFEYLAARRAVIASDLPSIREVVTDGETALLLPPTDTAAWTAAIARLRDDMALRNRLADAGYAHVMAHYTWDARARHILDGIETARRPHARNG